MSDQGVAAGVVRLAEGEDITFWLIGGEVWRTRGEVEWDTLGYPMGARWECAFSHWQRFRECYAWAVDVAGAA